ncbi:CopD family protein [Pullulanibacillus sp. KACC 23026]|uniref:copper resistance D family protein n=1 Tax=Pullulanibacillus sp. KACC 23026 TaxID=3028315 RepID=UPI0023B1C162|nr:CopD family protein [Pullulanibacillus sp. KACC 23026]WEG11971.1 CopD family protein [Pullulanibacillus sp. KACC 23026]
MVPITETLTYICFSCLMGSLLFANLSPAQKPDLIYSRRLLLWSTAGIGILSFFPILTVIIELSKDMGFWTSFQSVLFTFQIGQAWTLTLAISILLLFLIYFNPVNEDPILAKLAFLLGILLIGTYVKSGHAASLSPVWGFTAHFFHLLAVSIWGGALLIAAWGTKSDRNWLKFLKWFTPLAMISIVVVIVAGFFTMVIDISPSLNRTIPGALANYKNGLVVNYGQALLIKHLLIIPLILLAFFNGIYSRTQLRAEKPFTPIRWARLESIVLLVIFAVTAYMGQQNPPHELSQVLHFYGASPLIQKIYGHTITQAFTVHLQFGMISFVFALISVLLLILIGLGILKKLSNAMIVLFLFGYLCSAYFAVSLAIQ